MKNKRFMSDSYNALDTCITQDLYGQGANYFARLTEFSKEQFPPRTNGDFSQTPLKSLVKTDLDAMEKELENLTKLQEEKEKYSDTFGNILMPENIPRHASLNHFDHVDILAQIVEYSLYFPCNNEKKGNLLGHLICCNYKDITFKWCNNTFEWSFKDYSGVGFCNFISKIFSIPKREIVFMLMKYLNISISSCFSTFSDVTLDKCFGATESPPLTVPAAFTLYNCFFNCYIFPITKF